MITGARLSEMLSFNRSVVQNEIVKIASRLLGIDRKLNMMRIDEAFAWRRYAGRESAPVPDGPPETVRRILDQRHGRANAAIGEVGQTDVELASFGKPRTAAAEAVIEARQAFQREEALAKANFEASPAIALNRRKAEAVKEHALRLGEWEREAAAKTGAMLRAYAGDRAFSYLRRRGYGTEAYRRNILSKAADGWLAQTIGYVGAAVNRAAVEGYAASVEEWKRQCASAASDLESEAASLRDAAMRPLELARARLAAALNGLDAIDARIDLLAARRANGIADILQVSLGQDPEYQAMVDTFVRLLAKERAAAMVRVASSSGAGPDAKTSADIDAIVSERIKLSMEADGLRRHMADAARRLKSVEDVASRLSMRQWDTRETAFEQDGRTMLCHDLSTGTLGAEAVWAEIEGSRRGRAEAASRPADASVFSA